MKFEQQIQNIQQRNARVEANKAWETSWTRRLLIAALTYVVIAIFMKFADLPRPWISALIPTLGFILSTLTVSAVKTYWMRHIRKI